MNISQHGRTSLRITNNLNTGVLHFNVTNGNIRQQHRDFLRITTIYLWTNVLSQGTQVPIVMIECTILYVLFWSLDSLYFYSSRRLEKWRYNKPLYNAKESGYWFHRCYSYFWWFYFLSQHLFYYMTFMSYKLLKNVSEDEYCQAQARLKPKQCLGGFILTLK